MFDLFNRNLVGCMPALIDEARAHGASYYPDALKAEICGALSEEVALQCRFEVLHNVDDTPVIEDMEIAKIPMAHPRYTMITRAGMQLAQLVNPFLSVRGIEEWLPNQAAVHRYHAGLKALGAHRDYSSDELLIAVFTLRGEGQFELLHPDGSIDATWNCVAGGLCLMRGPNLTDDEDDRPLHRAAPPKQYLRESLIYRQINWKKAVERGHSL